MLQVSRAIERVNELGDYYEMDLFWVKRKYVDTVFFTVLVYIWNICCCYEK